MCIPQNSLEHDSRWERNFQLTYKIKVKGKPKPFVFGRAVAGLYLEDRAQYYDHGFVIIVGGNTQLPSSRKTPECCINHWYIQDSHKIGLWVKSQTLIIYKSQIDLNILCLSICMLTSLFIHSINIYLTSVLSFKLPYSPNQMIPLLKIHGIPFTLLCISVISVWGLSP